jgi:hypothetical protein
VVEGGVTIAEPEIGLPDPVLKFVPVQEAAFVSPDHERTEFPPAAMEVGFATSVTVGAGGITIAGVVYTEHA